MWLQCVKTNSAQLLVCSACERERARAHARRGHTARGALRQVRADPPATGRRARLPAQATNPPGKTRRSLPGSPQPHAARP